jgi:uncharacterized delta-60 repeat protein
MGKRILKAVAFKREGMHMFISPCYQKIILSVNLVLVLILVSISIVFALGPGDLDRTFNNSGIVRTTINGENIVGTSVAIQPDGKILVSGHRQDPTQSNFIVARYEVDGRLDSTFSLSGTVVAPIGQDFGLGSQAAIQSNGKIVVAGTDSYDSGKFQIAAVRFDQHGNLDTNFGNTGILTTSTSNGNDFGYALTIQPDDKILVAGRILTDVAIARYTMTGTLDTTFKGSGIVTTTNGPTEAYDIAFQNDRIVAVGVSVDGSESDYLVVRYDADGNLDTGFNGNGIVTTSVATGTDDVSYYGVAIQPDDKIVATGEGRDNNGDPVIVLARYNDDGTLDPDFNGAKVVTTSVGSGVAGAKIAIQDDGEIVVAGTCIEEGQSKFVVVRYNSDGSLDTEFGNDGFITTAIDSNGSVGRAVALQDDGKIVVTGFGDTMIVVRYLGTIHNAYLPVILKSE